MNPPSSPVGNPPPAVPAPSSRIPSLDGLRGIAILCVLLGHGSYSLSLLPGPFFTFAGNGALGVSIFFVLSGFLIYNLSVREFQKTGGFSWKQFYLRRVLRIFPCFYLFIAVILVLKTMGKLTLTWPMIIGAGTFSQNYVHLWSNLSGPSDYFVIGHYWTLALEEQFYLTWPVLMLLFARKKLLPVLVVIMVLAPFLRIACYFLTPGSRGQIAMMFHTGFDSIAAGVLLGELLQRARPRAWLTALAANRLVILGAILFVVFISPLLAAHFRGSYEITIGKSLVLACLCVIITSAVSFPGTLLYQFLNWRPLVFIGVLSYSLYVWNNLFLYSDGHWRINSFPFNFICLVGMALASHYCVERPFLRLKDRFHQTSASRPANAKQKYA